MKMVRLGRSLGLITSLLLGAFATANAQSGPWSELARKDLEAIRQTVLDHHPGPVDPLNPAYRLWVDRGYEDALEMADSVAGLDGLMAVISWYVSGFDDGHLGWGSFFERRQVAWPGFVVSLRGDAFLVDHVAEWISAEVQVGSEVVSCDGESLDALLLEEVMPFEEGIATLEASRVRLAPELFVYDANPWRSRFAACRIRGTDGEQSIDLQWRGINRTELEPLVTRAAYGEGTDAFEITRPADGLAWVTLPSFAENRDDNRVGLERLVEGLPDLRDEDLVVFDVRGNRGGNSYWAGQILYALFGETYIDSVEAALSSGVYVEWRASTGNADFVERSSLSRYEPGSDRYTRLKELVDRLRDGVAAGNELVPSSGEIPEDHEERAIPAHPLGQRVVLLTDGWCASACLDFADVLLAIPGVRHLGAPTYADAVYIDNRGIALPSGIGVFGFSMKVYRNRPRGHNEPYEPDVAYPGERWETEALQAWVIDTMR